MEALRITLVLGVATVLGLVTEQTGWCLLVAVTLWSFFHFREYLKFAHWAAHPLRRPDDLVSAWRTPVENLYRVLRNARHRSHRLLYELKRFQSTYDAIPDGAVIISEQGQIEKLNKAATRLLGVTRFDLGQNLVSLVRHPELVSLIDGCIENNIIELSLSVDQDRHLEIRRIDLGRPSEFDDNQGRYLILVRDVTELNRLLTMRQDFIANVSHEIRTPLTVIMGYLETLSDSTLSETDMRAVLRRMNSPANRMKALVEDLSLLTRLESSPIPEVKAMDRVDVVSMLKDLAAQADLLSEGKHRITLDAEPIHLFAIETELYSAFNNLITNAVRYSPGGGEIDIRWVATPDGVRFEISDQGIGIPSEHLERLTERFYRVDFASARVKGGTGLGLAIAKHVLKRHNSSLQVTSIPGEGSRFWCDFPPQQIAGTSNIHKLGVNR